MRRKKVGTSPRGKKRMPAARSRRTVTPLPRKAREEGRIRLAIATQPALLRDLLSRLLKQESDMEVVGQAHDEDRIIEVIREATPALLLFDYEALGPNSDRK